MEGLKNSKSGISLVALIVTIIVLIILTAAVIITFMDGGIVDRAKQATFKSDIRNYQDILLVKNAEKKIDRETGKGTEELINAETLAEIQAIIPEFKKEYENLVKIEDGKLVLGTRSEQPYAKWLADLGIEAGSSNVISNIAWEEVLSISDDVCYGLADDTRELGSYVLDEISLEESNYRDEEKYIVPNEYSNLIIPNNVTSIRDDAFRGYENLKSVTIPSSVTSIGNYAFYNCTDLENATILGSNTSIGDYVFCNCTSLEDVTISGSITTMGHATFRDCNNLRTVILPENIEVSDQWYALDYVFCNCTSLESIRVPYGIEKLSSSFYNCTSLVEVELPTSINNIYIAAFANCTSLTDINYNGTKAQWNSIIKYTEEGGAPAWDDNSGNYTVHCTDGDIAKQ